MFVSEAPASLTAKPIAAVFDFDGTLSAGTSGIRFYRQLLGTAGMVRLLFARLPWIVGYTLRCGDEASLDRINRHVFRGRRADDVIRAAEEFARHAIPTRLLPCGMARLDAHRQRGDRCVIVSRGYTWCLEPWARSLGITDVIGTRLEIGADGRLTGRMPEPSCDSEHKRTRLLRLLGPRDGWEIHAYGDSAGDRQLLAEADRGFIRRGDRFEPWPRRKTAGGHNS